MHGRRVPNLVGQATIGVHGRRSDPGPPQFLARKRTGVRLRCLPGGTLLGFPLTMLCGNATE